LEHIRKQEFLEVVRETRRELRSDGICSHRVDLRDHLGGSLNNLRFSRKFWESDMILNSGFYTNRIRLSEMVDYFRSDGFSVGVINIDRWEKLPTPAARMSPEFRDLPEDELRISGFDVILRPV
jgi:hypothetical protein